MRKALLRTLAYLTQNRNQMLLMKRSLAILPFVCVLSACATPHATPTRGDHFSRTEVIARITSNPNGITFVSRDGRMYGMDSDARITLKAESQTEVTEFGYAIQTYNGTYAVDEQGAIRVSLRHYPAKWPTMYIYSNKKTAWLFPADRDPSFRMGGRAGAVETSRMKPYWPFRQIN